MRQAIVTKFIGPSNTKPARVIATAEAGKVTVSWDHALETLDNHTRAARLLAEKWGWTGTWYGGALPNNGGYVYVQAETLHDPSMGADHFTLLTPAWGFECWGEREQRWSHTACGEQDSSNTFASRADAEAELPNLAKVMGVPVSQLRVVDLASRIQR